MNGQVKCTLSAAAHGGGTVRATVRCLLHFEPFVSKKSLGDVLRYWIIKTHLGKSIKPIVPLAVWQGGSTPRTMRDATA